MTHSNNPVTITVPSNPHQRASLMRSLSSIETSFKLHFKDSDRKDWLAPSFISR